VGKFFILHVIVTEKFFLHQENADDNEIGLEHDFHVQNNDNSERQQQGFVTIQIQSDSNDNINLDGVHDDTTIRELLVNIKRFSIYNLFYNFFFF